MKQLSIFAFSLMVIFCSSCGGDKKEQSSTAADTVVVEKDSMAATPQLTLVWETDTTLTTCESALSVPEQGAIYVSCINGDPAKKDGNGFISKVNPDGKIENVKWSQGKLNAPKGMGVLENTLYVTDIDELVKIDLTSGKVSKKIKVPGAKFLNDVTVAKDEKAIYFSDSDSASSAIYRLRNDSVTVWLKDTIQSPNGLYHMGDKMYVASLKGDFKVVDMASKKVSQVASGIGGGDGVTYSQKNNQFIVSSWFGEVFTIQPEGKLTKILDLKDQKLNSADIDYMDDRNIVLVPTFFGNKVMAYEVKW
jgi:hypothetical protein